MFADTRKSAYLLVDLDDPFAFNVLNLSQLITFDQFVAPSDHFVPVEQEDFLFVPSTGAQGLQPGLQCEQNANRWGTLVLETLLNGVHHDALGEELLRTIHHQVLDEGYICSNLVNCIV